MASSRKKRKNKITHLNHEEGLEGACSGDKGLLLYATSLYSLATCHANFKFELPMLSAW